ncbi:hypothetical protein TcasGA2_TC034934 [Tribolium castaneum]|uniref:Reverse transcriptase domain-containing protein n=1 Tax=Tribolium castaneum TaxID=7070 RepID=A0A139WA79_TRICA|nr:hypothetical protein TcasGA2_TC034934 [Tribolium castaneum]
MARAARMESLLTDVLLVNAHLRGVLSVRGREEPAASARPTYSQVAVAGVAGVPLQVARAPQTVTPEAKVVFKAREGKVFTAEQVKDKFLRNVSSEVAVRVRAAEAERLKGCAQFGDLGLVASEARKMGPKILVGDTADEFKNRVSGVPKEKGVPKRNVILEVTGKAANFIRKEGQIFIGFQSYKARLFEKPMQCYRCLSYGHGGRTYQAPVFCSKSGKGHLSAACKAEQAECANCKKARFPANHGASSKMCPDYKRTLQNCQRSRAAMAHLSRRMEEENGSRSQGTLVRWLSARCTVRSEEKSIYMRSTWREWLHHVPAGRYCVGWMQMRNRLCGLVREAVQDRGADWREYGIEFAGLFPDIVEGLCAENRVDVMQACICETNDQYLGCHWSKTPGPDGMTPEMLRAARCAGADSVYAVLSKCLEEQGFPLCWKVASLVVRVAMDPGSYRAICLLPVVGKVFERILVQRLMGLVEGKWDDMQYDFTSGRLTEVAWARSPRIVEGSVSRTVLLATMRVLMGELPWWMEARRRQPAFQDKKGLQFGSNNDLDVRIVEDLWDEWQGEWDPSEKGRVTYQFVCDVRMLRDAIPLEFSMTELFLLTGYGSLNRLLYVRGLSESQKCACGADVEKWNHILVDCERYAELRDLESVDVTVDDEGVIDVSRVLTNGEWGLFDLWEWRPHVPELVQQRRTCKSPAGSAFCCEHPTSDAQTGTTGTGGPRRLISRRSRDRFNQNPDIDAVNQIAYQNYTDRIVRRKYESLNVFT